MLNARALNRALLERQMLITRSARSVPDVVEHLAGMQAQAPFAPYYGLWTRLEDFRPAQLADLINDRTVVRIALLRGTVHLVTARDSLAFHPVLMPFFERMVQGAQPYREVAEAVGLDELILAARKLYEERPLAPKELRERLGERWPGQDAAALASVIRQLLPLVQLPPRAIWGAKGQTKHTTVEAWLGRPLGTETAPDELVLRYLAAFGPATIKDMQTWCGITRLREVTDRLGARLRVLRDESGSELYDLPDAPLPDPATPVPARFLPEYDNLLRSHADRTRVMSDAARERLRTRNDAPKPTFLVDGFVRGGWTIERNRGTATLVIAPFERLTKRDTDALLEEGTRLLAFAAEDADHDIRFDHDPVT